MITWGGFYVFLFVYRCFFSVFGQIIVLVFTRFLGDAKQYQNRGFTFSGSWFLDSNLVTENVGAVFSSLTLGNPFLINIGFQAIGFVGIYRLLVSLDPVARRRLAILAMFPSFTLWTSVASKEAILTFALGVVGAYMVDLYNGRARLRPIHIIGAVIIFVFKIQYGAALLFFYGTSAIAARVKEKTLVVLVFGLASLFPLYVFREKISALSFEILPHFSGVGRSTRDPFWIEKFDVFSKAGEGMFFGFVGPTFSEALSGNPLQFVSFVESAALVALLLFFLLKRVATLPAYNLLLALFTSFWLLFPNYPFGIMNPGSAIRYRSGYLILLCLVVVLMSSTEVFVRWKNGARRGRSPDSRVQRHEP